MEMMSGVHEKKATGLKKESITKDIWWSVKGL